MYALLVDTGPLYAAADPSDHYHKQALEEMNKIQKEQIQVILALPILCEAYTLIMRNLSLSYSHQWLTTVYDSVALINPTADDYLTAKTIVQNYQDQKITLFDAVVASISFSLKTPVWTYDSDFDVLGVDVWRF